MAGRTLLVLSLLFAGQARADDDEPLLIELEPEALAYSELEGYEIGGGFTWQGQFDYLFTPHLGVEASWAQREGALTVETSSGSGDLFEIDAAQLLGSVVYRGVRRSRRFGRSSSEGSE